MTVLSPKSFYEVLVLVSSEGGKKNKRKWPTSLYFRPAPKYPWHRFETTDNPHFTLSAFYKTITAITIIDLYIKTELRKSQHFFVFPLAQYLNVQCFKSYITIHYILTASSTHDIFLLYFAVMCSSPVNVLFQHYNTAQNKYVLMWMQNVGHLGKCYLYQQYSFTLTKKWVAVVVQTVVKFLSSSHM